MNALADATQGTAGVITFFWLMFFAGCIAAYWAPTIVAAVRKVDNLLQIAMLNLFGGWTVFGWVFALVWALKPAPAVQLHIRADDAAAQASLTSIQDRLPGHGKTG